MYIVSEVDLTPFSLPLRRPGRYKMVIFTIQYIKEQPPDYKYNNLYAFGLEFNPLKTSRILQATHGLRLMLPRL